ncbi:amino acid ABC transporter ATP-binding protein [Edwardsiella ictaluri]|uniref:ABC transmembrane type-1 domain-containing protein n=1 Tax=Edwardsiella ictaluri (strain 93-146) TaxID=634503 RepID=C5B981_EDWI9|nr:ABC transporter permease subunit [Edwardsiella ictaluri]ACR70821.2 hypothetical protein NT01EI_3693 [Edwardsiella ictaluri 93-146]AVZ82392.1 amino acid ABC transporter ATP-binding protein [Edwardsiella ictaluri]EKS7762924.1 ABC transporter permease subunit [Edwardsiella ictaluri]EKS7769836.1 ABC transporter permease subunit [Edwardsiella ictaluri]EKS7772889.1 ABC transporter permease subunit [Edwardsiella ictaluri]
MNWTELVNVVLQLSQGVITTTLVTVSCFITGMVVALLLTGIRQLELPGVRHLLDSCVFIFRSVPVLVLVLVFLVYFGLPNLGWSVSAMIAINLSLGLIAAAFLSEVFRGALNAVDRTELLAAKSMGLGRLQIFFNIEAPQMIRFSFPGVVNEFSTVLKNSAFAYTIGISEIMRQAMALTSTTNLGVLVYVIVGFLYFCIYKVILFLMGLVEHRIAI